MNLSHAAWKIMVLMLYFEKTLLVSCSTIFLSGSSISGVICCPLICMWATIFWISSFALEIVSMYLGCGAASRVSAE